ncbi:PleD family two-component system response regulator [Coleofasciculus sp. FACHB-1120]|uniref:diguanylate cyclase domain-containing protein n=1 Tax=Coleofasciculus sp. FACHB-1120 TaxID=2692783 RepID=UPI001684496C|nr:PleD family two-component system response regulator [Coleofasciculus sp. FACHB-1120]MBD2742813.1 PleD family two-component system response regulator [Coleofasciculus sp. FACHB-1120]
MNSHQVPASFGDILVVDDHPDNLRVLSAILSESGYQVRRAINGQLALKVTQNSPPALILLDILMPEMDGYAVCSLLKAHPQTAEIPVIFISALDDVFDKVKAFEVGGVDYITKPFQAAEVLARVKNQLIIRNLYLQLQKQAQKIAEQNASLQQEIQERKRAESALVEANLKLQRLASLDSLTGVANRRQFNESLNKEWQRMAREQFPLSLILGDIDYFKKYNDTYGHLAGDFCLQQVAQAISRAIRRPADILARYGGEEFAVILPNTKAEGALKVAEAVRHEVLNLKIAHAQSAVNKYVTLSLGVFTLVPQYNSDPSTLIAAADKALYEAKEQGRNRSSFKTFESLDSELNLNLLTR